MITITQDKILGFAPLWAPFNGFSLLFDNPDNGLSPLQQNSECMKLESVSSHPSLKLYQAFVDARNRIDTRLLTNTYLFCPLPPSSFHVTVWDGLNVRHFPDGNPSGSETWEGFVKNLPNTFDKNSRFTEWTHESPLVQRPDWNITFQFGSLYKWYSGMGILLEPADQESAQILKEIEKLREALYENFPVKISHSEYTPHVTLGYFANNESAQLATPLVSDWEKIFEETTRDLTITYRSMSLYGFTDMITFFKTQ